ncbi:acyltransferase family protein [Mycolicibacterium rhodesiae]|uniref:acyltransferase family protein n=1 Tax=Mycolicibacterium rhodesiae TaxID=36814 RepID=UPI003F49871A
MLAHSTSLSGAIVQPRLDYFRPDIEGLRAIAVVAVVLFHAEVPGIRGGYVGVDVFFVISGFLITGMLWREAGASGSVRLRSFYGARARRLLPASALVGVVTMVVSILVLPPLRVPTVLFDGIYSALYVGNYWFVLDHINYFNTLLVPSPFLHYWSLGVEEQFYLVWAPLVLGTTWIIRRFRRDRSRAVDASPRPYLVALGLVATVSFALSLVITYAVPSLAFFSLPTRAWQLAAGGLVALTAAHWRRLTPGSAAVSGWAGICMIVFGCFWFTSATPFPGTAALLPTLGAVLVIGSGCAIPSRGAGRFLGTARMRAIGRISYSWYLWHWPVLVLLPAALDRPLGLAERIIAVLLAAGLAWLTLRYVENPLRFAPAIRDYPWRSLGLGMVATVIAVATGFGLLRVVPIPVGRGAAVPPVAFTTPPAGTGIDAAVSQSLAEVHAALATSLGSRPVPSNLTPSLSEVAVQQGNFKYNGCLRTPYESGQPECAMGDTSSPTTVALIGDSHAAMWTPAFQEIALQRHWRLELLAKEACAITQTRAGGTLGRLIEDMQHCQQWRDQIVARLTAERPRLVIISVWRSYGVDEIASGFNSYDQAWFDGMTHLVRQLHDAGSQVLVLGPIPAPHQAVTICLSGHLGNAAACDLSRSAAVNQSGIAMEASATRAGGGQYVDVTDLFCTADRCPAIVGNTLVYLDTTHLSITYAQQLAPAIGALTDRAMAQSAPR